nr:hypothetical protein [Endozoicomonas sp.]
EPVNCQLIRHGFADIFSRSSGAVEDKSGTPSLGASGGDLTTKFGQFSMSDKVSTNNVNSARSSYAQASSVREEQEPSAQPAEVGEAFEMSSIETEPAS